MSDDSPVIEAPPAARARRRLIMAQVVLATLALVLLLSVLLVGLLGIGPYAGQSLPRP